MKRIKIISLLAVFVMIVAACSPDEGSDTTAAGSDTTAPGDTETTEPSTDTTQGGTDTTQGGDGDNPLAEYGEDPTAADPALIEKALGPVSPSDADSWNIILAAIARADQNPSQEIIDKAMECWNNPSCETGTGGPLTMGYADGGGHINVWRSVSHMEAILQALSYPEIGRIVSTEAQFAGADAEMANIRFLIQDGADFIVGYPDWGAFVAPAIQEATDAGIPYVPFSAGWVGLPDQEGALIPGEGYLTVVGEDLCALGESFAEVLNTGVVEGTVGVMGGSTGNALTLGWQRCLFPALEDGVTPIESPPDANTTVGDTFWLNDNALALVAGWLSTDPDIAGYAYEYSDGLNSAFAAYEDPIQNMTVALRTDEQTLFCSWADANEPTYRIFYSAGGNFQSRVGVTAAMMSINGADIPPEVVVPHVMREVTTDDCNPDRVNPFVSGTSLVPDSLLGLMFPG